MNSDKKNNIPLVTVVMPVFNSESWLKESIESILNQTFHDFILLIINDGSTDESEKIILSFTDSRIHYIRNEKNIGLSQTLNKSVQLTRTKYYARMDADDISLSDRLKTQYEFMEKKPDIGVCGTLYEIFGSESGVPPLVTSDELIRASLLFSNIICHPTVMIRKELLEKISDPFSVPFSYHDSFEHKILELEDYALWHKLKLMTKFATIEKILLKYRKGSQNISNNKKDLINSRKKQFYIYTFKELNIELDDNILDVLIEPRSKLKISSPDIVNSFHQLLIKVVNQNKLLNIYPQEGIEKVAQIKWKRFFYFCADAGKTYLNVYKKIEGKLTIKQRFYLFKKINRK